MYILKKYICGINVKIHGVLLGRWAGKERDEHRHMEFFAAQTGACTPKKFYSLGSYHRKHSSMLFLSHVARESDY